MPELTKLTDEKREEMFKTFSITPNTNSVARKCEVHHQTAKRYRKLDDWDKRLDEIRKRSQKALDNVEVKRRSRYIKLAQALQKIGSTKFFDKDGKLKQKVIDQMTAGDGVRALTEGIRIEKETVGDSGAEVTIKIKLPKDLEDLE